MQLIKFFISRSRLAIAAAVAAGAISGLSSTALLAVINRVLRSGGSWTAGIVWLFAALAVIRLLTGILSQQLLIRLSQRAIYDLRVEFCEKVLAAPLRAVESLGIHRLLVAFTDDTINISTVVINIPYMLVNLAILIGSLIYLGWLSWVVLAGIVCCMSIGVCSYLWPVVWANRRLRAARQEQDKLFNHFRVLTEGSKELRLHAPRRGAFLDLLRKTADEVRCQNVSGISTYSTAATWGRLLFFVYTGLLLFLFPSFLKISDVPTLAGYILVLLYMMAPLEAVMNVLPHIGVADAALKQIESLRLRLALQDDSSAQSPLHEWNGWRSLELQDVTHRYDEAASASNFSLGPISLTFQPGTITFLMGGNGSGKSTLAKIVTGLYEPASGSIRVDAQPIRHETMEAYRQMFSAVFSDFGLFEELLGQKQVRLDERAKELLVALGLHRVVQIKNGALSTTALSSGQRKRLALLTALLEDRPFYVFDEWAADQDVGFKEVFYSDILPTLRQRGKAVLVITHDQKYQDLADHVLVLEEGQLVSNSLARRDQPRAVDTVS